MSRNQPSTSKYKISQPQPLVKPELRSLDSGPYPSYGQQPFAPAVRAISGTPTPGGSPLRPARSQRRAAEPPTRQNLTPLQTQLRRPSESGSGISPISPVTPADIPSNGFSDPWAVDRSQRSELRAQTSAAAAAQQLTVQGGGAPGTDRLRNVVGAFMSAGKREEKEVVPRRQGKSGARKPQQQQEVWEMDDGKFGEIDGVLKKIRKDWPFVMESDFSPSTLALSLLSDTPSTSLPGHPSLNSFMNLHNALSTALQTAVQSHFQSFAASLPAHAAFLATLGRAQQQVRTSKEALKDARDGFAGKGKSELAGVRARERVVRDMLKILDTIDDLKQVPDQLEALIGEKKFLQAALILIKSLKTINKPELTEIGAVSDLRSYFALQETVIPTIEPQSETALENRPASINGNGNAQAGPGPSSRFSRYLSTLAVKPSQDPALEYMGSDTGSGVSRLGQAPSNGSLASIMNGPSHDHGNPEADSYAYMEVLLESLAALGRLGSALDMVAQRVPTEIHTLVDTTLDEVEERIDQRRAEVEDEAAHKSIFSPTENLRAVALDAASPPRHAIVLRDLFWTLYSKLAAVLESHRVVYEVSRWISSTEPEHPGIGSLETGTARGELFRMEVANDSKAINSEIKVVDDSLKQALKTSVPGLVNMTAGEATVDDRFTTRHRTLIPPNAFNVSTLFQPTLSFIHRATAIVPPGFEEETGAFSSVLEDFVVQVFLPQLDEKVTASFQQAVSGYDAFQIDRQIDDKPPVKPNDRLELANEEIKLEMSLLGDEPLVESQLVASDRKLQALGNLSQSLRWFIDRLLDLQAVTDETSKDDSGRRTDSSFNEGHGTVSPVNLHGADGRRYEAIIQTYEQLVEMVLNTMRLEIRCRVICNLSASLRKGDFRLESEALEPDPDIVDLNTTLTESDEITTQILSDQDKSFVFRGLGHLVDHLFIHAARSIKMVNEAGVKKIKRNIVSLQQSLRSIVNSPGEGVLTRSIAYWDLYEGGPKCKADQNDAPSSELNTYLIDLHALSMSIEGWDDA
ncbi:exocyst complex component 4, partial [Tremellales sp. Uapishka_1]